MADGSVLINTELNDDGLKKGISKLKSGFNKIGSIASTALKGVTVAIGTATTALAGLGVASVNSYADLEQNIGGVETLFKGSAKKVIQNAENAYKTAGMNANEYMATVTSFSASLLQSLGGDTEKAANTADMAIIDMSDNANKMGTSMEAIQNAYQGFAKQNYTMLDNLKLGYGGTKTEMERLLSDAQKITGVKYDISNLNDVYSAIHVIQGQLDITGTTAKEAASTITGSINSMKSAFDNFLNGSGKIEDLVDTGIIAIQNIVNVAGELLPNVVQSIANATPEIIDGINLIFPQILNLITTQAPIILSSIGQILVTLGQTLMDYVPEILQIAMQLIKSFITGIINMLPQILQAGITLLVELIKGIAQMLPKLIPMAIDCIITLVETLLDNIDQLIDAGIQLILALADGLIEALPRLIEKIPVIIEKLINAIVSNLPKLVEAGIKLIIKLAEGLVKAIPQLRAKIPQIIGALINGIVSCHNKVKEVGKELLNKVKDGIVNGISGVLDIGKNILEGLWNGIKNAGNWIKDKVKGFANGILDGMKNALGIHSPSRVFRDEVGKYIALGVGEGFDKNIGKVYKDMRSAVDFETQKISANVSTNAEIKANSGVSRTIQNNNDNGVQVTQNFYEKVQSPYETAKQTRNTMRRIAYGY